MIMRVRTGARGTSTRDARAGYVRARIAEVSVLGKMRWVERQGAGANGLVMGGGPGVGVAGARWEGWNKGAGVRRSASDEKPLSKRA